MRTSSSRTTRHEARSGPAPDRIARRLPHRLITASIAVIATLAVGATSAQAQVDNAPPSGCPPLWTQAFPPLNPALKCVPDFVSSALGDSDGPPPTGTCPPKWKQARPPLNPALGCVPDFVDSAVRPQRGSSGGCPPKWKQARPPLNPALGCVPQFVNSAVRPQRGSSGGCPPKWKQARPPLNPALGCVPQFVGTAVGRV